MAMGWMLVTTLAWLQTKHFVADYVLQPAWMIKTKGDVTKPGGYIHAGLHAIATLPALWLSLPNAMWIIAIVAGEFFIHFSIDYIKAVHGGRHPTPVTSRFFWVLHGADQLAHQLTYSAILAALVWRTQAGV